jgi:hypothetical protein
LTNYLFKSFKKKIYTGAGGIHVCNPATQKAEIGKIMVRGQPGQNVSGIPSEK